MSFFGRAANLVKGGLKRLSRPVGPAETRDRAARERALEEELGRPPTARPLPQPLSDLAAENARTAAEPTGGRAAPERDEQGNIKRTL